MLKAKIHDQVVKKRKDIEKWFSEKRKELKFPIYSSFDIRDSGYKIANVDANIFPAGFNNICEVDRDRAPTLVANYLKNHYSENLKNIVLLTEEHTHNSYYWENIWALKNIFEKAGKIVRIAIPREFSGHFQADTANGNKIDVYSAIRKGTSLEVDGMTPDLVVSNNDFSESYADWYAGLKATINPPREMGWYRRKKSDYFREYNSVMAEFSQVIEVDPWCLQVDTELFEHFDIGDEKVMGEVASKVDIMIKRIQEKYLQHGIAEAPFIFIKNNSGTYGLGVLQVKSGEEVMKLNYKGRKKMKAAKGGREVSEVIIQEGISTSLVSGTAVAEPTIYLLGCELLGGFLRTHSDKSSQESLNSPGAVYKRLCVSDLEINVEGKPMENVYGWIARLGLLAIGREYNSFLKTL
ncbi:MAG: glutamate--cysteine ligase [Pseudomonadota bacterium]|nr:glutamate--cysteine ligase [Pseudomonadota bacterium]